MLLHAALTAALIDLNLIAPNLTSFHDTSPMVQLTITRYQFSLDCQAVVLDFIAYLKLP